MQILSLIKNFFKKNNVNYSLIEEFQFTNLLSSPIRFVVIDLRLENSRPELRRALKTNLKDAQIVIKENCESPDFPILIICEDGKKSETLAKKLIKKNFKNVVLLKNGTQSLTEEFHKKTHSLLYR